MIIEKNITNVSLSAIKSILSYSRSMILLFEYISEHWICGKFRELKLSYLYSAIETIFYAIRNVLLLSWYILFTILTRCLNPIERVFWLPYTNIATLLPNVYVIWASWSFGYKETTWFIFCTYTNLCF